MLTITPIPALDSNYFWLIQPNSDKPCVYIVDPGDAEPVIEILEAKGLHLEGILITHHHKDHTGGALHLKQKYQVPIYGPKSTQFPYADHPLAGGNSHTLDNLSLSIIDVSGHTLDHIAYFLSPSSAETLPLLFCGDALFAGGCGRRMEGSAEIMWQALTRLAALPENTQVYCAHEYTLNNLLFAIEVEPQNEALKERLLNVKSLDSQGIITLPSTIGIEKETNPFMRCHIPAIAEWVAHHCDLICSTPASVFEQLRYKKDTWRRKPEPNKH